MKEKLVGKNKYCSGFSTLELMIAFALISIVLVGAISGNFIAQYWTIASETSNEGLYKAKTKLEDLRSLIKQDFYSASSTLPTISIDPADPADSSCISGGLCYFVQTIVTDISTCSKYVEARVEWKIQSYPTTTTSLFTNLTNSPEIVNRGGDCILNTPSGDWTVTPQNVGSISNTTGKQYTNIDVLNGIIYATSNTAPSFLVYNSPTTIGSNPTLTGSYDLKLLGFSLKINDVDVEKDLSTGRTYAFLAVSTTTNQLAVLDVTDKNNPALITQRTLQNVDPLGSYPEGWRIYIYGNRLYMTTRETATNEFHIFDISTPTLPTEIGNGYALDRTVNDVVIRDQKITGVKHRLVYLAEASGASPYSKQLRILDVTGDIVTELNSVNLPGIQNGLSLSLSGNKLFFGREQNGSGPELYVFDVSKPNTSLPILGQGEVNTDITKIEVSGKYAYLGTNKVGQEFQVWNSDHSTWNPGVLNSGRFTSYSYSHLSPLGFDIDRNWIYLISQFPANDSIQVIYRP